MNLKPKEEVFCHAYIETSNASEAYRRAYPHSRSWKPDAVWVNASKLLAKVRPRVEELQSGAVERHEVTVESIAAELDLAYRASAKFKQGGAMVAAVMGKAKLYGLIVNKHENVNELTDEQRDRRIRQLMDERERSRTDDAARAEPASTRH